MQLCLFEVEEVADRDETWEAMILLCIQRHCEKRELQFAYLECSVVSLHVALDSCWSVDIT